MELTESIDKLQRKLLDYEWRVKHLEGKLNIKRKKLAEREELYNAFNEFHNSRQNTEYSIYFKFNEKYPKSSGKYFLRRFILDKSFRRKYMTNEMCVDVLYDLSIYDNEITNIEALAFWCYDNIIAHNYNGDEIIDEIEDEYIANKAFNSMI